MTDMSTCTLATELANRMRSAREELTREWLNRIAARAAISSERLFPSEALADHVPVLIDGIADYVENPAYEITAENPVIDKAMELGALRLQQGFDPHEILKEYEILGGVLFAFAAREVEQVGNGCSHVDLLTFAHRLFSAIAVIEQVTTRHYLKTLTETVDDREEQLRNFNRLVSHDLKNKIGAVLGAGELVAEEWISAEERQKFIGIVLQNARSLQKDLEDLTQRSRVNGRVNSMQRQRASV